MRRTSFRRRLGGGFRTATQVMGALWQAILNTYEKCILRHPSVVRGIHIIPWNFVQHQHHFAAIAYVLLGQNQVQGRREGLFVSFRKHPSSESSNLANVDNCSFHCSRHHPIERKYGRVEFEIIKSKDDAIATRFYSKETGWCAKNAGLGRKDTALKTRHG